MNTATELNFFKFTNDEIETKVSWPKKVITEFKEKNHSTQEK